MTTAPEAAEAQFREHMRALAERGGAATKRKAGSSYYRDIGRLGGRAAAAARRERFTHEAQPRTASGAPIVTPPEGHAGVAWTHADETSCTAEHADLAKASGANAGRSETDAMVRKGAHDAYVVVFGEDPTDAQLDALLAQ